MTLAARPPEAALAALGFTDTEAAVYCELLRGGPATGYRLAKAIGKAPANTYQALAALAQKGAVLIDGDRAKAYRAVAAGELLAALQGSFDDKKEHARAALDQIGVQAADDRIYQLLTPAQVYERAAAMIAAATNIILFDLFPQPLAMLSPLLAQAAGRGVRTSGLVYETPGPLPFVARLSPAAAFVADRWPGLQLSLVVDAREHMVALLADDGQAVRHAVWSDSAYLACLKHSGLAAEIRLSRPGDDELESLSLLAAYPPGLQALVGPRS